MKWLIESCLEGHDSVVSTQAKLTIQFLGLALILCFVFPYVKVLKPVN